MSASAVTTQLPENQQHLVARWETLTDSQRESLSSQLAGIDFDLMAKLFFGEDKPMDWNEVAVGAESPPAFRLQDVDNTFTKEQAIAAGEKALCAGQLGVVLVAGGQGSRLGFDHPKGMYPIAPLSRRTLFQMHVEQIRAVARRYGVSIPLYLMTSPATHQETVDFLNANDRFGLPDADLQVFCQGTMPALDAKTGAMLLASPEKIFESPDGHGGTVAALEKNGCLDDMVRRRINELFYFQVDNPLVEICQPEAIGYHLLSKSELTTQVVAKQDPMDKVGNVIALDGEMMIIEYSDLPAELSGRRDATDKPIFWAGNIAVHVFSVEFMRRMATVTDSLPYHRALKRVPFINASGETVTPTEPNAIKFEKFIFDLMPLAKNPIVVEVNEIEVFAPLKNASGAPKDTPESTRDAIVAKHTRMLESAGATVKAGVRVEINPLFALDSADLKGKIGDTLFVSEDQYFDD